MAGQVIIEGFLDVKFPIYLRRLITIIPAFLVIATGLEPFRILVLSQVVLSFALPFALIPLLILTSRPSVMDSFASAPRTRIAGWAVRHRHPRPQRHPHRPASDGLIFDECRDHRHS